MNVENNIIVAIHCLVYNHEAYLRDCLDGFVMQKTNFRYVAIVHDDCSTDKSSAILTEYAEKFPDIIKPIYEDENQYKKVGALGLNHIMNKAIEATGAKYVAMCEGDDYWTDPQKLQKQVDFLESHSDYTMCFHGADVLNETYRRVDCACENISTREYFTEDAFPKWQIPTASIMYRYKEVMSYPLKREEDFEAGDVVLNLRCMATGRVWGMAEHMCIYRMNQGGVTSRSETMNDRLKMCKHYEALMLNFPKIDKDYCHRYIAMVHYTNFRLHKCLKSLLISFSNQPTFVLKKMLRIKSKPRTDIFYQHYGQ